MQFCNYLLQLSITFSRNWLDQLRVFTCLPAQVRPLDYYHINIVLSATYICNIYKYILANAGNPFGLLTLSFCSIRQLSDPLTCDLIDRKIVANRSQLYLITFGNRGV